MRTASTPSPYGSLPRRLWRGRVLIIDNEDSFAHNLAHACASTGRPVAVVRHDRATADEVLAAEPAAIVLSPGPRAPESFPLTLELAAVAARHLPVLGVCLGHQAIGVAFGARVVRARVPVHGKRSPIRHGARGLFQGLSSPMLVGRYHSLVIDPSSLPSELDVIAWSDDAQVMAIAHRRLPLFGVQFHPESYLTAGGRSLLENFFALTLRRAPEVLHA